MIVWFFGCIKLRPVFSLGKQRYKVNYIRELLQQAFGSWLL